MTNEKIIITGMGIIVPKAKNVEEFTNMLRNKKCGLSVIENIGPNSESIVGGYIEDEYQTIDGKNYKRYPKFARLAIASACEAVKMAKINGNFPKRTSVVSCTSTGGLKEVEYYANLVHEKNLKEVAIQATAMGNNHSIATGVASHFGIKHHAFTMNDSCNAAIDALFFAKMLLETNQSDMVILTGAETPISSVLTYTFAKTKSIYYNKNIDEVGRPFSNDSKGFALSEGAATIILERESNANERNAKIFSEIKRIGLSFDSISILQSDESGKTMYTALEEACGGDKPDYINSQALGLKENDRIESNNFKKKFKENIPITTIKGNVGQALGVVGLIQIVSSLITIEENFIPATIRTNLKGYEDLPVPIETINKDITKVLITCHGFGGNNGCVLLEKMT